MSLDTNYNGKTYLSKWWTQVHANLQALWDRVTIEIASEQSRVDTELANKLDSTQYATATTPGIVTLHSGGSGNNSGLLVGENGDLAVNVSPDGRFGLTRDGAGQIKVYPATEDDITAGTDTYKPIVPKTLKNAVESITGEASINIYTKNGLYIQCKNFTEAIGCLNNQVLPFIKAGIVGFIKNSNIVEVPTGNGCIGSTQTALPAGVYFWIPDKLFCSLNNLEYKNTDGKGLFMAGYLYIIELGENNLVLYSQYDEEQKNLGFGETIPEGEAVFENSDFYRIHPVHVGKMPTDNCIYIFACDEHEYGDTGTAINLLTFDTVTGKVYKASQDSAFNITTLNKNDWKEIVLSEDVYSQTPTRVGTWIDGTPIWRIAFPFVNMVNGERGLFTDEATSTIYVSLPTLARYGVVDDDNISVYLKCEISCYDEYPSYIYPAQIKGSRILFSDNDSERYQSFITDGNGYWGGYIEFATPESNLAI